MRHTIRRFELENRIRSALSASTVSIVCAPAGAGKSTLLDQIFSVDGAPDHGSGFIVRLDQTITNTDLLLRRFGDALAIDEISIEDPLATALDWLSQVDAAAFIIVDDIHTIAEAPEALAFFVDLVNATAFQDPRSARRWVFTTRTIDVFPHAVWLAGGRTSIIDTPGLFDATPEEVGELFDDAASAPSIRNIGELTLLRAIRGLAHRKSMDRGGTRGACTSPVPDIESIDAGFNALDALTLTVLRSVRYLYHIDLNSVSSLIPQASTALASLLDSGLIFNDLAMARYRLRDDVRELCFRHSAFLDEAEVRYAAELACMHGSAHANTRAALAALLNAEQWQILDGVLGRHGFALLDREPLRGTIHFVLTSLPGRMIDEYASFSALQGTITTRADFGDVSEAWYGCALELAKEPSPLRSEILYRYGGELARRTRPDASQLLLKLLEENPEAGEENASVLARGHSLLGALLTSRGELEDAERHFNRAQTFSVMSSDRYAHARVLHDRAYASVFLQRHREARDYADQSLFISLREGLFDLAGRSASLRTEIEYTHEHNFSQALHFTQLMLFAAGRADDSRVLLMAYLQRYWLAVESGDPELAYESKMNIERSAACDDHMQRQIRQTIIPATAMMTAWNKRFAEAAHLLAPYALSAQQGNVRAYRWAELSLYYAAAFRQNHASSDKLAAVDAFRRSRSELEASPLDTVRRVDILTRLVLALLLLERHDGVATLLRAFSAYRETDGRASVLLSTLEELSSYARHPDKDTSPVRRLIAELERTNLGGVAFLIGALPFEAAWRETATHDESLVELTHLHFDEISDLRLEQGDEEVLTDLTESHL